MVTLKKSTAAAEGQENPLGSSIVMGDTDANVSILPILAVLMAISSTTREYRMSRDQ